MLKKEAAVQLMKHLVEHDWHGYSQVSRWGDGEGTCDVTIGGQVFKLEQGDRDCSSAIISVYEAAGISCGGATYTGNMRPLMTGTGNFRWHPMSSGYVAQAGDIYLNEACHTAMCLTAQPDMLMEFAISETGGIDGAEGDQTGQESHTRAYYNYPWDGILECINTESIKGGGAPVVVPAKQNGHNVHLYENNGNPYQKWNIEKEGDYIRLKNRKTGEYLDTAGKAKSGMNLKTYKKSASAGQLFKLEPVEDKTSDTECYKIASKADQKLVVDVAGAGTKNKTNIQLYNDNGTKAQQWYFRKDADGYMIFNVYSLKALDGGGAL